MATSTLVANARTLLRSPAFDYIKTALFVYVLLTRLLQARRHLRARGLVLTLRDFWKWLTQQVIFVALRLPAARKKVDSELQGARAEIERKLIPSGPNITKHLSIPPTGHTAEWILEEMAKMDKEIDHNSDWQQGKLSGAVYHGGDDLSKILVAAFDRYCVSNPLHPDVFPTIRKMEAEVVSMVLRMYNNPEGAGTTTSGGTESIIMSVKAHRDWARATKGITEPEIIVPESAHAAFDKGGAYLKIKVHTIPVDPVTRKVDLKRVARAINGNTIMLAGSCINFPDGNQDDIVALGKLAKRHRIGLHVDCCLGSFIVPFLEQAGFPIDPFDFRVEGVTAISCDTHKYGFAPKGNSVIMYRNAELRSYQYYVNPTWMGGVYASPSIAGSRPGSLIAGTWAAMHYMGQDGYLESCRTIVGAARTVAARIRQEVPELYVLGSPPATVVAFASKHPRVNMHEVGDVMSKKGWHLNAVTRPAALHLALTRLSVPMVDQFLEDLKDAVKEARLHPSGKGTMVSLYGLGESSAVGSTFVAQVATMFIDALYKP